MTPRNFSWHSNPYKPVQSTALPPPSPNHPQRMNEQLTLSAFSSYSGDQAKYCPGSQNSASACFHTFSWRISFKRSFQLCFFLCPALSNGCSSTGPGSFSPGHPPHRATLLPTTANNCAHMEQQGQVLSRQSPGERTQSLLASNTTGTARGTHTHAADVPLGILRASHHAVTGPFL